MMAKMEKAHCKHCDAENGFSYKIKAFTLAGQVREVEVMRCFVCDAPECPNPKCDERTLNIKKKNCGKCGFDLVPKARK